MTGIRLNKDHDRTLHWWKKKSKEWVESHESPVITLLSGTLLSMFLFFCPFALSTVRRAELPLLISLFLLLESLCLVSVQVDTESFLSFLRLHTDTHPHTHTHEVAWDVVSGGNESALPFSRSLVIVGRGLSVKGFVFPSLIYSLWYFDNIRNTPHSWSGQ